jgi:hypothetical protein
MVRTSTILLTTVSLLAASAAGCAANEGSGEDLDRETAALVIDNDLTEEAEQDLEGSIEQPLSGATSEDGTVDTTSDSRAAEAAVANPGTYFKPAGCLQSTRAANVVTHVFDDCTGPYGRVHMTGTVTSTWTKVASGVQVVHAAQGFHVNGAIIDHTVTITYAVQNGVYTWRRLGTTSGATAGGLPISHSADYTTTWEPQSRCVTRDGRSQTTLESREFSRRIDGYERCGVGLLGCPNAGTYTLDRARLHLELHFGGGRSYDLVVNGHTLTDRSIAWCIPS